MTRAASTTAEPAPHAALPALPPAAWLMLVAESGLVEPETLEAARREAGDNPPALSAWLVGHGVLTERDAALFAAQVCGLPFIDPAEFRICPDNRTLLPEELLRAHGIFPIFALERILTLAVPQPLELAVLDQIRLQTGCEVDQCLAAPRDISHVIDWAFGGFHGGLPIAGERLAWDDILKDVNDAPAVRLVNVLLDKAAAVRASDVHIDADEQALRVRLRVDGVLREVPAPPRSLLPAIASRLKVLAHMDIAETRRPQDGHFKLSAGPDELDVRVSTLPSADGEAIVLRLLRSSARLLTLEELGMDDATRRAFDRLIQLPHGMLLVTGPTGSGKTTTLYSALSRLDRTRRCVITLEDPVEMRLSHVRQVAVNAKAGLTFAAGLRSILRQDPDVILVGEIRDRETAETALQAALTGHLLLSTLHTNSAAGTVARLIDMGAADFLVASAMIGVMAQRLCRRLCRHCARPADDRAALLAALPPAAAAALADAPLREAVGCRRCGNTGFDGRVGVFELLIVGDEVRRIVMGGKDEGAILRIARAQGLRTLIDDGLDKVAHGHTTLAELLRVVGQLDGLDAGAPPAVAGPGRQHEECTVESFDPAAYERLLHGWLGRSSAASAVAAL